MKLSLSSTIKKNIKESIALAEKLDMGIEISRVPNSDEIDSEIENIKHTLEKAFINFPNHKSLHGMFFDLSVAAKDPAIREISRKRFCQSFEIGKAMGAKIIVFHSGNKCMKHFISQEIFKESSISFWKEFIKKFEDAGMTAVIENVHEPYPNMILDIVKEVNSPNLGVSLDTGHANLFSKISISDWIKNYKPYLKHMHIHNNSRDNDSHNSLLEGTLNFKEIISTIKKEDIKPMIVFEMFKQENLEKSMEFFNHIYGDDICLKN